MDRSHERHGGLQNGTTLMAAGSVGLGCEAIASFNQENETHRATYKHFLECLHHSEGRVRTILERQAGNPPQHPPGLPPRAKVLRLPPTGHGRGGGGGGISGLHSEVV